MSGEWASISKPWEIRRDAMLDILTRAVPFIFKPAVQLDSASTLPLIQALNGRTYEKTQIEKKNYHVVNAFTLLLTRFELWKADAKEPRAASSAVKFHECVTLSSGQSAFDGTCLIVMSCCTSMGRGFDRRFAR